MKNYRLIIIIIGWINVFQSSLIAGELYAGEFLLGAESPKGLALGNNGFSIFDGGFNVARNPALLADITKTKISLMHTDRFLGTVRNDLIGVATPYGNKGLGIAIYRTAVERIPFTKLTHPNLPVSEYNRVVVDKYVSNQEWALWISQGIKYTDRFYFGASLKSILKVIGNENAFGLGIDVGSKFNINKNFYTAITVSDLLTSPLRWSRGKVETIKPRLQTGVVYTNDIPKLHADFLTIIGTDLRFDQGTEKLVKWNVGFEYLLEKFFALRVGIHNNQLLYGGGVSIKPFQIDYAFNKNDLGNVHTIGLSFSGDLFIND